VMETVIVMVSEPVSPDGALVMLDQKTPPVISQIPPKTLSSITLDLKLAPSLPSIPNVTIPDMNYKLLDQSTA